VGSGSDPATQTLHTEPQPVHIKEEKMFIISDVVGGTEFFDTDVNQQSFSLAENVMKVS